MLHHAVWWNDREAGCIGGGLLRRVSLPLRTICDPLAVSRFNATIRGELGRRNPLTPLIVVKRPLIPKT
jgi:hypothetical protein